MAGNDAEHRSPPPLDYARPLPAPPWQMRFLVVATGVCAGMLLAGMAIHAWRMATTPTAQMPGAQMPGAQMPGAQLRGAPTQGMPLRAPTTRAVVGLERLDWVRSATMERARH